MRCAQARSLAEARRRRNIGRDETDIPLHGQRASAVRCEGHDFMDKPRILVVDDEENIRYALKRWFEVCGFDVDLAEDGLAAVQKCAINDYAVITMDLEMPRMTGSEAIAEIKIYHPDVPIIIFTGYSENSEELAFSGASMVLSKPLSLRKLEEEVRRLMAEHPRPSEPAGQTDPEESADVS
jgi:CheY-like chemotaxis protein